MLLNKVNNMEYLPVIQTVMSLSTHQTFNVQDSLCSSSVSEVEEINCTPSLDHLKYEDEIIVEDSKYDNEVINTSSNKQADSDNYVSTVQDSTITSGNESSYNTDENARTSKMKNVPSCKKCGKPFTYMEGIKAYIYSCDCDDVHGLFGESFKKGAYDKIFVCAATGKKVHCCSVCGMTFSNKAVLNEHIVVHNGTRPYKCTVCGKAFTQKSTLNTHAVLHTDIRPHQCHICGKAYHIFASLRVHLRQHINDKQHKCTICGKAFLRKTALNGHLRVHNKCRPFKCNMCEKAFPDKSALTRHMYAHIGYKPHKCPLCDRTFTQKYNLRTHMIVHTGVKAFECPVCEKKFGLKQSLGSHMKTHEKNSLSKQLYEKFASVDEKNTITDKESLS